MFLTNNMYSSYIIVDNFYANPYDVYNFAIKQSFDTLKYDITQPNNYTLNCMHTISFSSLLLREIIQNLIKPISGNITHFDISTENATTLNGSFQCGVLDTKPIINYFNSGHNTWIGILFLDPNTDIKVGVSLCKHKSTINSNDVYPNKHLNEIDRALNTKERFDYSKWNVVDYIGSVFNRLVCFRASSYHRYDFNVLKESGNINLYQFFIFNTER